MRGENRVGAADPLELREESLLQLERLYDRLNHEVALRERLEVVRDAQPRHGRVVHMLPQLALLDLARQETANPGRSGVGDLPGDLR